MIGEVSVSEFVFALFVHLLIRLPDVAHKNGAHSGSNDSENEDFRKILLNERDVAEKVACANDRYRPENGAEAAEEFKAQTIHAGCAIIFWPLSFVLPNALRAANDVKFTMVVSILSMACWRLGFSYLLCVRMGWGAVGVWVAMVIDWTCRVTCFVLRFRSGAWKTKYQA